MCCLNAGMCVMRLPEFRISCQTPWLALARRGAPEVAWLARRLPRHPSGVSWLEQQLLRRALEANAEVPTPWPLHSHASQKGGCRTSVQGECSETSEPVDARRLRWSSSGNLLVSVPSCGLGELWSPALTNSFRPLWANAWGVSSSRGAAVFSSRNMLVMQAASPSAEVTNTVGQAAWVSSAGRAVRGQRAWLGRWRTPPSSSAQPSWVSRSNWAGTGQAGCFARRQVLPCFSNAAATNCRTCVVWSCCRRISFIVERASHSLTAQSCMEGSKSSSSLALCLLRSGHAGW
mmetsp:Transcript_97914/g.310548  ORF Transcript_97914/g.310548 Transcript_97914/m.310548 type:complete len:290 (+) Transcript_97914:1509-2378(+)